MATISWNGTPGDWNSTTIWTGGVVPGSADTASFTGTTTGTVNVNVAVSIAAITSTNPNVTLTMSNTITLSGSFTWQGGTLTTNNNNITCSVFNLSGTTSRTITLGTSTVTCTIGGFSRAWSAPPNISNLNFSGASSTITLSSGAGVFDGSGASLTYGTVNMAVNVSGVNINGTNTFGVLNITGTAVKTNGLALYANQTVTGTLTITGNSAINRVLVYSDTLDTPRTITVTGATVSCTNVDFRDINMVNLVGGVQTNVDLSSTSTGDCQGNSGITFTTGTTLNWQTAAGGTTSTASNWSDGSISRTPLPQDNRTFNIQMNNNVNITEDMPRCGKNTDFSSMTCAGTTYPYWIVQTYPAQIHGSLTMISNMRFANTQTLELRGRGSYTMNGGGKNLTKLRLYAPNGSYTITGNIQGGTNSELTFYNGTFNADIYNITFSNIYIQAGGDKAINMGSGTWETDNIFSVLNQTGVTLNAGSSTIRHSGSTFTGGTLVYNNIVVVPNATTLTFSGNFTFNNMTMSTAGAKTVKFTGGSNVTTTGTQFLAGSASGNVTVTSTNTTPFTLTKNSGLPVKTDYLTLSYSTFASSGGVKGYAGSHSTNGGNNTGWIFGDAPILGNAFMFGDMF